MVTLKTEIALRPIELVKQQSFILSPETLQTKEMLHLKRLFDIIGTPNKDLLPENLKIEVFKLVDVGFHFFVAPDFIKQFKYHAQIGNFLGHNQTTVGMNWWNAHTEVYNPVVYVGDIPDSAIERIEVAKRVSQYISIHSNQMLPVRTFDARVVDPIVIAWLKNPRFYYPQIGGNIKDLNTWDTYNIGAIVAIWNEQNELEL